MQGLLRKLREAVKVPQDGGGHSHKHLSIRARHYGGPDNGVRCVVVVIAPFSCSFAAVLLFSN